MSGSDLGGASYKHLKYCFFSATMSLRRSIQKISYMVEFRDIQNYFQTVAFFRGKFVFDHRVSVGSSVTNIYGTCLLCACIILFYHGGKPAEGNYANSKICFHVLYKAAALAFYILSALFFDGFVIVLVVTVL
ncbi:uncharacterized protein [Henckelia pumila]|uniref:uncharacterized protein isoform X4 n=1 Tax=Henckelia pumila TaxID=405737 RepID=UPI003C6DE9D5